MDKDFGFIYVLTNPAMPGYVKIGMTRRRPERRVSELSSATGVPVEFDLYYSRAFENAALAERMVHTELEQAGLRVNDAREFFQMDVEAARVAVDRVSERLAADDARSVDVERFVRKAEHILAGERPGVPQLEQALSYYQFAVELGDVVSLYHSARVAQVLAEKTRAERSQDYEGQALALYAAAAAEGVARAHAQMALIQMARGKKSTAKSHWKAYFGALPPGPLPDGECQYLLGVLFETVLTAKDSATYIPFFQPYRKELHAAAAAVLDKRSPQVIELRNRLATRTEKLLERLQLPLAGALGLALLYLADPAIFERVIALGLLILGIRWLILRRTRSQKGTSRHNRESR